MSLSQDDFRRLLATPRNPPAATPKPNQSQSKHQQQGSRRPNDFARPSPIVPSKFRKKEKVSDGDDVRGTEGKFRDRARERREGANPDYIGSEEIIAQLAGSDAAADSVATNSKPTLYEQSKYLGGDLSHTHLVKGLDFALLKKVRADLESSSGRDSDVSLNPSPANTSDVNPASNSESPFKTAFAEKVVSVALFSDDGSAPVQSDSFVRGRMSFCWNLGDRRGLGGDSFPTIIMRSRSETKSEKIPSENSEVVISKLIELLSKIRQVEKPKIATAPRASENNNVIGMHSEPEPPPKDPVQNSLPEDDEDIFAGVGRDYSFESRHGVVSNDGNKMSNLSLFVKPSLDDDDDVSSSMEKKTSLDIPLHDMLEDLDDDHVSEVRSKKIAVEGSTSTKLSELLESGVRMVNSLHGAGAAETLLNQEKVQAKKVKSGLSFSRSANNYGEEDTEFDQYYDSDEDDDENDGEKEENPNDGENSARRDAEQLDMGIKARKRTQLKRYDFETEAEFQAYKDSQVVMPKSAYQFGVKSADGRKNRRELSSGGKKLGEDAKLDREMKQLDKMMGQKYGMSLSKSGKGDKKREGEDAGQSGRKRRL
ncbi:hypothetical protein HDU83_002958 [Entophlyctis luteolus]|nr:hypothetical protein HDU83_002958 [Entophlyctis luteolus]KAJ3395153.1 hypothetical protein HDU84_002727 [Entophlyctis sp. JEL0112]